MVLSYKYAFVARCHLPMWNSLTADAINVPSLPLIEAKVTVICHCQLLFHYPIAMTCLCIYQTGYFSLKFQIFTLTG